MIKRGEGEEMLEEREREGGRNTGMILILWERIDEWEGESERAR